LRKDITSPANSRELKAAAYSTGGDAALTILYECVHYKRKNVCAITKKAITMIVQKNKYRFLISLSFRFFKLDGK